MTSKGEAKRDPRVDPKAGDILQKKYQGQYFESRSTYARQVDEVDDGKVTYVGENVCAPTMSLKSWRRWAKNAEVIHAAD